MKESYDLNSFELRSLMKIILFVRLFLERQYTNELNRKRQDYSSQLNVDSVEPPFVKYEDLWAKAEHGAILMLGVKNGKKRIEKLDDEEIGALFADYHDRNEKDQKFSPLVSVIAPYMTWLNRLVNSGNCDDLIALRSVCNEPMTEAAARELVAKIRCAESSRVTWTRFALEASTYVLLETFLPSTLIGDKICSDRFAIVQTMFNDHLAQKGLL